VKIVCDIVSFGRTQKGWDAYWEDGGLEEEHNHQQSETTPVGVACAAGVGSDSRSEEDHNRSLIGQEDVTRLGNIHETSTGETSNSEKSLGDGVEVGTLTMRFCDREVGTSLQIEVDEEAGNSHLCADVGELSSNTPEECVLLAERLVDVAGGRGHHLSLISHIGIRDFGDGREVEDHGEDGNEASNAKVDPLDGGEVLAISADILEDNVGGEDRGNDRADSLEGLGQLETELRPLGWPAHGDVRVGGSLEGG